MVFSSSTTVYGQPEKNPCVEDFELKAMNPYGRTKGSRRYCFYVIKQRSPYVNIDRVLTALAKRQLFSDSNSEVEEHEPILVDGGERMEEAKGLLQLFPIWATCVLYAIVTLQSTTFFFKQGTTMKRRI